MTSTMNWPPLPSWQIDSLNQLAANNQLSGVPPQVIAVIDQAESGGSGGGINSEGYGGFFGLGVNQPYPGGTIDTATMQGTDPSSFASQAIVTASAFASYLTQANGNPVLAEQIYQTGDPGGAPSEGAQLMSQYTGGGTAPITPTAAAVQQAESGSRTAVTCNPLIKLPLGVTSITILDSCQGSELLGAALMIAGGLTMWFGIGILLASFGAKKVSTLVIGDLVGRQQIRRQQQSSQIRMTEREHTTEQQVTRAEATASARRSGREQSRGPSEATRRRWQAEGFEA